MNRRSEARVDEQRVIGGLHDGDVAAEGAPVGQRDIRANDGAMPQRAIFAQCRAFRGTIRPPPAFTAM